MKQLSQNLAKWYSFGLNTGGKLVYKVIFFMILVIIDQKQ